MPIIIVTTLIFFVNYWQKYNQYNTDYAPSWQYGYQTMVTDLKTLYPNYNQIFITKKYGEPHEFILFYWPWDPQKYITDINLKTNFHSDWYWVDGFDKFKFINDWEIKTTTFPKNSLLITSPNNYQTKNSKLIKTIKYPNDTSVFDIVTYD